MKESKERKIKTDKQIMYPKLNKESPMTFRYMVDAPSISKHCISSYQSLSKGVKEFEPHLAVKNVSWYQNFVVLKVPNHSIEDQHNI